MRTQVAELPANHASPAVSAAQQGRGRSNTAGLSFKKDIQPILERSCTDCHSGENPKGSLNLETFAGLMKGGQSRNPSIAAGHADLSPLIRFARDEVEDLEMPPLAERPAYAPLTREEIQKVSLWIDQGIAE